MSDIFFQIETWKSNVAFLRFDLLKKVENVIHTFPC